MRYDGGRSPARSISVVELIASGTLDAELAGLLWLLVEARVPVVVAAMAGRTGKSTLLEAILTFLPAGTRRQPLAGFAEDFEWLPEAANLGWRHARRRPSPHERREIAPAEPATTYLVAAELSNHLPTYTWGEQALVAVRAVSRGYGLGATIHADSLEEVFAQLSGPAVGLTAEELSRLGVVLVLRLVPGGTQPPGQ